MSENGDRDIDAGIVFASWAGHLKTHKRVQQIVPVTNNRNHYRRKVNQTSGIVLGRSSPCTPRLQRKKTKRWPIAGNKMPMASSFL
jgi:hypothetical protein